MAQRRDAQAREQKRLHLLDVAASEFARVGFDQSNINTISERAGFGKGTVYLYTANKEQLFLDVLQQIGRVTSTALDVALNGSAGERVETRLEAIADAFARLAADHPDFVRLQASALFGVNRRFQDACADILRAVVQRLAATFAEETARGAMRAAPPDVIAIWLFGALQTFALLPQALSVAEGADKSPTFAPNTIAEIMWRGVRPETNDLNAM
jgi:AcrR family transcriptional regulator